MNKNTGAIKKHSVTYKSTSDQKEQKKPTAIAVPANSQDSAPECISAKNYSKPQLNSVLRQKKEIEDIEALQLNSIMNTFDLTPRSEVALFPKMNQKLNFDASKPVFKDLIPINVNDSVLLPKESTSIPKKYFGKKIPAPELSDFLDPLPPLEHVIPLPEMTYELPEIKFDAFAVYKRYAAMGDPEDSEGSEDADVAKESENAQYPVDLEDSEDEV